ncbi:antirestriction protein ArdA, partial [Bacteroides finegoldii]
MEAKVLSEAKVYVGTYAKYNNGSLSGAWLDLSDYSDKEEFYEACRELHKDEED